MVFSSFIFIFGFLPIFLACYCLAPWRAKNFVILLGSYLFYAWGAPKIVPALLLSSAADYIVSNYMAKAKNKRRRQLLTFGVTFNVALLAYYKYANFFVEEANRILALLHTETLVWTPVVLPIGISFFTFQKISYLVDVYRGTAEPSKNVLDYMLYVVSFPQLIAGPIIRYHDVSKQIESRRHDLPLLYSGAYRFCLGLGKKVLVADPLGSVAQNVLKLDAAEFSTPYAWLGIVCYAYQLYFDFSGYSDMAIGLGRMMGFRFLENFDRPYISQNFTEFWRRWHISLSRWMRDYLYIPLGGNRVSKPRAYLNLWIVFLLSGLWHGANWTFIVFGSFHGCFLMLDKLFWLNASAKLGRAFNITLTFGLMCVSFVFFRADSLSDALYYLSRMFNVLEYWSMPNYVLRGTVIHDQGIFLFVFATFVCFGPSWDRLIKILVSLRDRFSENQLVVARMSFSAACLVLTALALATSDYSPFIYFRF